MSDDKKNEPGKKLGELNFNFKMEFYENGIALDYESAPSGELRPVDMMVADKFLKDVIATIQANDEKMKAGVAVIARAEFKKGPSEPIIPIDADEIPLKRYKCQGCDTIYKVDSTTQIHCPNCMCADRLEVK
jgi:hypothetical protein